MSKPLEDIQDELLDRVHAGDVVDRDAVLAEHPEHVESLQRFFALLDEIERPTVVAPVHTRLGEFRLLREIGRGGMGIVHEAEQTSLKRRVALKVLPTALCVDPRVVARFRREAEAAGRLRHPNIVPVYAVGDEGGVPFFAMELVAGQSLAEVLATRVAAGDDAVPAAGAAWRAWVVRTVAAIADALEYAHEQGILHRDVKPGNILLEEDGTPRLTDFGLALDMDAPGLTMTGETFGTPLYMSPEQAIRREAPLDRRTDVYSLGVTLYEALTLRTPYEGTSMVEVIAALRSGRIIAPREADPDMPEQLERILLRALATSTDERYASAGELAADLRASLRRRGPAARERTPVRSKRARVAYVAGGVALAGAVLVAFALLDSDPAEVDGPSAAVDATDLAWAAVRAGNPTGVATLEDGFRVDVRMRGVISRADPGQIDLFVEYVGGPAMGAADLILYRTWAVQIEGAAWRSIRYEVAAVGPSGAGTSESGVSVAELLGDQLASSSVSIGFRVTTRALPRPESMERFAGGGSHLEAPAEWIATGGSVATWEHYQDVLIYDDYPSSYPERVSGASVDAEMRASLEPRHIAALAIGVSRSFSIDLDGFQSSGPLPTACEVDLCREGSDDVIATAEVVREATRPGETPSETYWSNVSFRFRDPPSPDEQQFALDVAARRIPRVKLVYRGSRRVALQRASFDRYWDGSFEVTTDVWSYVPSNEVPDFEIPDDAVIFGVSDEEPALPELAAPPWPTPPMVSRSDFERLLAGTHPDGEAVLRSWAEARVRIVSAMTYERAKNVRVSMGVHHGRVLPGDLGDDAATLQATWELSVDQGPWQTVDVDRELLRNGDPFLRHGDEWLGPVFGESLVDGVVDLRFRVDMWLVRGPVHVGGQPKPTQAEWDAVADLGTHCTFEFSRTVRLYETLPDDYPRPLRDSATRAAVERWLRAPSFSLSIIGPLDLNLDAVGPPPVPIAATVLVFDPTDGRQVGRATIFSTAPDDIGFRTVRVSLNSPVPAADSRLAADLKSGEKSSLRFVFRGNREAAVQARRYGWDYDEFWDGELDVTLPLRND